MWVFRSNGEMHHVRHFGNSYLQEKHKGTYSIDGKYLTMTVKSDMITVPFEFISEDKLQMQINGENSILNLVGNEYFYQEELRFESIGIPTGTMKYKVVFQYKNRPESTIELTAHNDEYAYIEGAEKYLLELKKCEIKSINGAIVEAPTAFVIKDSNGDEISSRPSLPFEEALEKYQEKFFPELYGNTGYEIDVETGASSIK